MKKGLRPEPEPFEHETASPNEAPHSAMPMQNGAAQARRKRA